MLVTIFTPVFNRVEKLPIVWESLQKQTDRNFEWIVVDDGSNDGILALLCEYRQKADFPVHIQHFPQNHGKHVAWNYAVAHAQGVLFLPADSDDSFEPNTIEFFRRKWQALSPDVQSAISGINVLCKNPDSGEILGDSFPEDGMLTNNLELSFRYKVKGEKWGIIRTDLLRQRPFPVFPEDHNHFFPESWIWYWLAEKYQLIACNIPLRNYYVGATESLSEMDCKKVFAYPRTKFTYHFWLLNKHWRLLSFTGILKYTMLCHCWNSLANNEMPQKCSSMVFAVLYWALRYPALFCGHFFYHLENRKQDC